MKTQLEEIEDTKDLMLNVRRSEDVMKLKNEITRLESHNEDF